MSNAKLDALKALFKKEKDKKAENGGSRKRGDMYPFWQMELNQKAIVRILPDANQDNPFQFFVDKLEHTLSIDGKDERIPCLQMYGEKCPICDTSRDYYKTEGKGSAQGKYYYRKKISLLRVLVLEDPLPADEETGENAVGKVLNTQFGYQLMEKIKEDTSSEEMDSLPFDLEEGYNFIIKKTPQGDYGTYTVASGFARKPTAISEHFDGDIELIDLQTLLPANPGFEFVKRKLDVHTNGSSDESDNDDEDKHERKTPPAKAAAAAKAKAPKIEAEDDDDDYEAEAPKKKPAVVVDDEDEDDIISAIRDRNRKKQQKAD